MIYGDLWNTKETAQTLGKENPQRVKIFNSFLILNKTIKYNMCNKWANNKELLIFYKNNDIKIYYNKYNYIKYYKEYNIYALFFNDYLISYFNLKDFIIYIFNPIYRTLNKYNKNLLNNINIFKETIKENKKYLNLNIININNNFKYY